MAISALGACDINGSLITMAYPALLRDLSHKPPRLPLYPFTETSDHPKFRQAWMLPDPRLPIHISLAAKQ